MSSSLWLGLDVGTQSTKALVLDAQTHVIVARASVPYDLIEGLPEGAAEQHPQTWADAVVRALSQLAEQGIALHQIQGVGVSGQQHGLVLLDQQGSVVRPAKLWCDTSTASEAEELGRRFGRPVPTGFTASKILWVIEHEPEHWAKTAHVMLPHDYINHLLTGRLTMEVGDASGSGFFDPAARTFNQTEVDLISPDLAGKLPELIEAPAPVGTVSAEGASWSGLSENTLVAAGGGDNMMSAIGSGAVEPGPVVLSLGTSGTVFACTKEPVIDTEGLIAPFCSSTGHYLPLLCTMNVTGVTEEVRQAFGLDHEELTRRASKVSPGANGLVWLPYLVGERVPDLPRATGSLLGLRHGWLDPGVLFRSAIEGTTLNLAWGARRMASLGVSIGSIRLVGGGSKNPLWQQITADIFSVPVTTLEEPESAALGGALQALWTSRAQADPTTSLTALAKPFIRTGTTLAPIPDWARAYETIMADWCQCLEQIHQI
ncbi:xylulokinase [Mucisphaera sp.]|uniref:xylulokinase n=1 Tax=Mucisphaera sp. TaxID=2913024 RepID=UPI003D110759